jgi:PilZ domain
VSRYVTVRVAGVGDLAAAVEAEEPGTLELCLADPAPAELPAALEQAVVVESVSGRGLRRVTGRAEWDSAAPERLRVLRGSEALVQRRSAARVEATVPALLVALEGGAGRAATTTVNLSGTGLLVRDSLGLTPGTSVRLELELQAGGAPVRVEGSVVRAERRGEMAVRFEPVTPDDRNRLARFIAERDRVGLRGGRAR